MKKIYSIIILCLLFSASSKAQESLNDSVSNNSASSDVVSSMQIATPEDLIARASIAYDQGSFQQSISDYETLLSVYGSSSDLYYNLANAYFKDKNYAKAILNYERCLLYDPSNGDAKANLELAKLNCVDKIETIQPVIFKTWSDSISNLMSCNTWTNLSIIFFLVFAICTFAYFFMKKVTIRKIGFYSAIVSIILCFICNIYANQQQNKINNRDYAIVINPSVTVKSSPADSGTQLFTVHEGLKVKVRSTLSDWSEVELSDGNVGWLPTSTIEKI